MTNLIFNIYKITSIVLVITCFSNCSKVENKNELIDFIKKESNGLMKELRVNDVVYNVSYWPISLLKRNSRNNNLSISKDSLTTIDKRTLILKLSISKDNKDLTGKMSESFNEMLKLLSFELDKYVYIENVKVKKLYFLKDFNYSRLYGSTHSSSVLLVFNDSDFEKPFDFVLHCKDFANSSELDLKFDFKANDIIKTPV